MSREDFTFAGGRERRAGEFVVRDEMVFTFSAQKVWSAKMMLGDYQVAADWIGERLLRQVRLA